MSAITGKRFHRLGRLLAGITLGWLTVTGPQPLRADDTELTVVSWGGSYTRSQILGFVRDYEKASGVDVDMIDYAGGIDEIRSQVRSWNIKWDVIDLELFDAITACEEGLLEPIDAAALPPAPDGTAATADFLDGALMPCGVGNVAAATVIAFHPERVGRAPQRLEDFFNVKDFPGRRGLRRTPQTNLEWALLVDGVAPERVYEVLSTEEGIDRAFEVLTRLKPYVEWWSMGEEAVRLLETGRVVMTSAYNGRIHAATERGRPFRILWDRHVRFIDVWSIPRHGENVERALEFVRFATSTQALAAQARYIPYGPMRRSSMALLDAETVADLPTAPENLALSFRRDPAWWARHMPEIAHRFERWVERPVMVPKDWPAR
ncbi:MAG: ABC transporter substrate-binding protein [Xanthomonadales bacterium]